MIEEEIISEIFNKNRCVAGYSDSDVIKIITESYEQGQKNEFIKKYLNTKIIDLETEIEELKWEQKQILEDNESYQKENEQLKKDLQVAIDTNKKWLQRDTKLEEENEELKIQIKK